MTVTFVLAMFKRIAVKLTRFCGKISEQPPASTEPVFCTTSQQKAWFVVGSTEGD
jgi:hypothetical protein